MSRQNDPAGDVLRKLKTEKFFRAATLERAEGDEESRSIDLAFSSQEPYERFFGVEILDHSRGAPKMDFLGGGRAPLLLEHDRACQIGVIEKAWIGDDMVGRATVRLGKGTLAEEVWQDIKDGIRTCVSVGYSVDRMVLEEEVKDGPDIFRVTEWTPLEVSIVSIPADQTVGVGRSEGSREYETLIEGFSTDKSERDSIMNEQELKELETLRKEKADREIEAKIEAKAAEKAAEKVKAAEERGKEIAEIYDLAARHNMRADAETAVKNGISLAQFRGLIVEVKGDDTPIETPKTAIGMSEKEVQKYSLFKAIRAKAAGEFTANGPAAFEYECHQAVADKTKDEARGFFVPADLLMGPEFLSPEQRAAVFQQRDIASSGTGSNLIATDHLAGSFINLLRNRMVVGLMGARVLDGLAGDVDIPKQAGGAVGYWINNETTDTTESTPSFATVSLSPKTASARVDMTRRMLLQSSPAVEGLVRMDLVETIALMIDLAAINGSGASGQPTGILNTSGIGDVAGGTNGAAPDRDDIVDLWREVAVDNANFGSQGYLTNALAAAKLMKTLVDAGSGRFVWEEDNRLLGHPAYVSNQVPSNLTKGTASGVCSAIIFGNFADLLIGNWGALDLKADEVTLGDRGGLVLRAFQDIDVAVRHAQSFAAMQDALTT